MEGNKMKATPEIQNAIAAYLIATGSMHNFIPVVELDYQIGHPETDEGYYMRDKCELQFIWAGKEETYVQSGKTVTTGKSFVITNYYDGTDATNKDKLINKFLSHVRILVKRTIDQHQNIINQLNKLSF